MPPPEGMRIIGVKAEIDPAEMEATAVVIADKITRLFNKHGVKGLELMGFPPAAVELVKTLTHEAARNGAMLGMQTAVEAMVDAQERAADVVEMMNAGAGGRPS